MIICPHAPNSLQDSYNDTPYVPYDSAELGWPMEQVFNQDAIYVD